MDSQHIVALFIDADNAPAKKIDFIISELAAYGSVMIRKIYGNWKNDNLKSWESILLEHAIQPIQQFDYTKGKNATDMSMTIDIMDTLYSGKVDIFCIVSSDCDFTPLAMRIKSEGKQVIGFGEQKTPTSLVKACSKFLYLDRAENSNSEPVSTAKAGNVLKQDTMLMNLLRDGIKNCQNEDGWANLGGVGSYINNQSSFDSKNYGYAKLSDLVKAIDIFETKLSENRSQMFIKNKRAQKS